jgi:hypothetical protein
MNNNSNAAHNEIQFPAFVMRLNLISMDFHIHPMNSWRIARLKNTEIQSTMTNTVCLISGANRGVGRGLVEALLSRPNTTIIAAVRNPNVAASQSLNSIAPRRQLTPYHCKSRLKEP